MTGLDGTPMPSFADNIKPDEAWDLVFYLRTFMPQKEQRERVGKTAEFEAGRSKCTGRPTVGTTTASQICFSAV